MDVHQYLQKAQSLDTTDREPADHRYYPNIDAFAVFRSQTRKGRSFKRSLIACLKHLKQLFGKQEMRVLDVGAGYGQVLYYLSSWNPVVLHGLEVDEQYVRIFQEHLQQHVSGEMICEDAFQFKGYDNYNFLWTYSPIKDYQYCKDLYKHIVQHAAPGTLLFDLDSGKYRSLMQEGYPIKVYKDFGRVTLFIISKQKKTTDMKLKDLNLDWKDYVIPSSEGKDVDIFHHILKEKYNYEPATHSKNDYPLILEGKVGIKETGRSGGRLENADPDSPSIKLLPEALSVWPEAYEMIKGMMDYFYPTIPSDRGARPAIGCSCGIYGNKPYAETSNPDVSVMATVNGAVGAAEGIVHELGHHKLHVLGLDLEEWTDDLFTNGFDEVFHSPVRFDKKRPIAAVVHAEFSYIYVTEYYNHLLQWMLDTDRQVYESNSFRSYAQRQAYNLKRIGNGIHTIEKVAKTTDEGAIFLSVVMDYAREVWGKGYDILESKNLLDLDWEPEHGKPV